MQRSPSPSLSTMMTGPALTYDEISMQHSRHFVVALEELKNLRPQLYSAAEYCESSYLYSEQKQAVLENLKDYSVKALVNAVDHLGTVACKLNDLLAQQAADIESTEIRVKCAAQRLRACQEYTDREGLKQQVLLKTYPRHHKHYVFPDASDPGTPKTPVSNSQKQGAIPEEVTQMSNKAASPRISQIIEIESSDARKTTPLKLTSNGNSPSSRDAAASHALRGSFPSSPAQQGRSTSHNSKASAPEECNKSLSALMSTTDGGGHKELRPVPSRSKSMFMSLLGRKKSFKVTRT